jgi:hypothetical protein
MVTLLKRDHGVHYSKKQQSEIEAAVLSPRADSRDLFIHGPLGPAHAGGCSSIPVLIAAVARRLGYPVKLVTSGAHVLARWDGLGERFNIEASNPMGMTSEPDEHYRRRAKELARKFVPGQEKTLDLDSDHYFRSFTPADELAMFLGNRVICLDANGRSDEAIPLMARALMLCPDDPAAPATYFGTFQGILRNRYRKLHPAEYVPDPKSGEVLDLRKFATETLAASEQPWALTIMGHRLEQQGDIHMARMNLEAAFQQSGRNPEFSNNFQRFLRKHLMRGGGRKITYTPQPTPEEEHRLLRQAARRYEVSNTLVSARDAWAEAYLLVWQDVEALGHSQRIEKLPEYRRQLAELEAVKPKNDVGIAMNSWE